MAFDAGAAVGKYKLDTSNFEQGQKKVTTGLDKMKGMAGLAAKGIAVAAGAVAAAGVAAIKMASDAGKAADKLLDLEQITGLSTTTLQELKNVSSVAGVSFEGLTGTITKFTARIPQIVAGTGESAKAFAELGVELKDASGNIRSTEELFPEMIESLRSIDDVTKRNILAQQVFGKQLGDLAPVLGMTKEQYDDARIAAHELGLVQSKEGLNAANNFRVAQEQLQNQMSGLAMTAGVTLAPSLTIVAEGLSGIVKSITELLSTESAISTIDNVIANIGASFMILKDIGAQLWEVFKEGNKEVLDTLMENFEKLGGDGLELEDVMQGLSIAAKVIGTAFSVFVIRPTQLAINVIGNFIELLVKQGQAIMQLAEGVYERDAAKVGDALVALGKNTFDYFANQGQAVTDFVQDTINDATEAYDMIANQSEEDGKRMAEAYRDSRDNILKEQEKIRNSTEETTDTTQDLAAETENTESRVTQAWNRMANAGKAASEAFKNSMSEMSENAKAVTSKIQSTYSFFASNLGSIFQSITDMVNDNMEQRIAAIEAESEKAIEEIELRQEQEQELAAEKYEHDTEHLKALREQEAITEEEYQARIAELDEMAKADQLAREQGYDLQKTALQESYDKKLKAQREKQFKRQKAFNIASLWVDTATAIIAIWASSFQSIGNPIAAAVIAGILTAAMVGLAIAQTVMIAKQKPPAFELGGRMLSTGVAQINEDGGEMVVLPGGAIVIPNDISREIEANVGMNTGRMEVERDVVREQPIQVNLAGEVISKFLITTQRKERIMLNG